MIQTENPDGKLLNLLWKSAAAFSPSAERTTRFEWRVFKVWNFFLFFSQEAAGLRDLGTFGLTAAAVFDQLAVVLSGL